mmetsp:Transcript_17844/g.45069  ORF Transcript_17844/g.45069 Transcript_17844/m.45069 type:complete len:276 (-) Transcript_17844:485-1312(-)
MALAHRRMAEIRDEGDGGEEVLDVGLRHGIGIRHLDTLVSSTQLLEQHLGTILNRLAVNLIPEGLIPVLEVVVNHVDHVPQLQDLLQVMVAPLLHLLGRIHQLRELKDASIRRQVCELGVELEELLPILDDLLIGGHDSRLILEEGLLLELNLVALDAVLKRLNVLLDLQCLPLLHILASLLGDGGLLLDRGPLLPSVIQPCLRLVHVDPLLLKQRHSIPQHIQLQLDGGLLELELVDARVDLEKQVPLLIVRLAIIRVDAQVAQRRVLKRSKLL